MERSTNDVWSACSAHEQATLVGNEEGMHFALGWQAGGGLSGHAHADLAADARPKQHTMLLTRQELSSAEASALKSAAYHCSHSGQPSGWAAMRRASSRPVSAAADRICWWLPR